MKIQQAKGSKGAIGIFLELVLSSAVSKMGRGLLKGVSGHFLLKRHNYS